MPDEFFNRPPPSAARPAARPGGNARMVLGIASLTFIIGAALAGWLIWSGRLPLVPGSKADTAIADTATATAPPLAAISSTAPDAASGATVPQPVASAPVDQATQAFDQRIGLLEQRMSALDVQAQAASGNAGRAEGLLIAFAARRAVERGLPLGYLEDQLKLRFAQTQPTAVDTVINAARQPLTLDQLAAQLSALEPALAQPGGSAAGWEGLRAQVSRLFVVRRGAAPDTHGEHRLDRARLLLRSGQVEAAATEIAALPGASRASAWLIAARRYAGAQRSLDLIEAAALTEPRTAPGTESSIGGTVNAPAIRADSALAPVAPPSPSAIRPSRGLPSAAEADY